MWLARQASSFTELIIHVRQFSLRDNAFWPVVTDPARAAMRKAIAGEAVARPDTGGLVQCAVVGVRLRN
jgi:hypothetical protein